VTVSSTAFAVALTSLPTPRTVLAHAASATAQTINATGASRDSFMDESSDVRYNIRVKYRFQERNRGKEVP
jgi:hypothetical protein